MLFVIVLTPLVRDPDEVELPPKLTVAGNWLKVALFPAYALHSRGKVAIV